MNKVILIEKLKSRICKCLTNVQIILLQRSVCSCIYYYIFIYIIYLLNVYYKNPQLHPCSYIYRIRVYSEQFQLETQLNICTPI